MSYIETGYRGATRSALSDTNYRKTVARLMNENKSSDAKKITQRFANLVLAEVKDGEMDNFVSLCTYAVTNAFNDLSRLEAEAKARQ